MIKAKNIYKSFGEIPILKGIDLHINESEIVSIVGASGAGKTTLLHILSSLSKPSEPKKNNTTVEINGTDISKVDDKTLSEFRNRHIGFIFQFHQLLPELSALENAMLPALIGKFKKKEAAAKATEILTYLGLEHRLNHAPAKLSGGEQQRVAIARALVNNPKVIFADEPSGNLDSKNATELHQLFFDLRKKFNQTFVIVTHNEELAEMANRKLVMNDGFLISS